jgi:urate oxidase
VETRLYSETYSKCFTDEDNTGVVATDTQKNNVYVVAKRTPASSPEQFGVDIARHFLNEYPILSGIEINVQEHPWERVSMEGGSHNHGFSRASPAYGAANVKLFRDRRGEPEVTSSIRGLTVLKTTQSGWEKFLKDKFTTLGDVDDRCMSTEVSLEWTYVPKLGGAEPDYLGVRTQIQDKVKLGFFGPPKCGVYSPSVQATVYDIGCMVLESVPDVANITINTPNLHYLPFNLLEKLGEKFENDIYLPTSDPSGNIQCTVEREMTSSDGEVIPAFEPHAEAIKSDIRTALINMKSNACPMAMRVAWHASGTWDRSSGTGGSDGATMRFEPEFSDGANAGLTMMIDMLKPVKDKHPEVSVADIWALAGAAGIEFLGGPKIPFAFGRSDASGKESQRSCPANLAIPEMGACPMPVRARNTLETCSTGRDLTIGRSSRCLVATHWVVLTRCAADMMVPGRTILCSSTTPISRI